MGRSFSSSFRDAAFVTTCPPVNLCDLPSPLVSSLFLKNSEVLSSFTLFISSLLFAQGLLDSNCVYRPVLVDRSIELSGCYALIPPLSTLHKGYVTVSELNELYSQFDGDPKRAQIPSPTHERETKPSHDGIGEDEVCCRRGA